MLNLTTDQKAKVTVRPLTAKGKPTVVDGIPGWSTSNPSVISLVVSPDGLSADVIGAGVGTAIVTVSADADLTSGIREITAALSASVILAEAASLTLEVGTPTL
jgi:hypothetical protein